MIVKSFPAIPKPLLPAFMFAFLALLLPGASPATECALRLATTTSTADSGLLNALLPDFERAFGCKVDVLAVGTGQALEIGRRGDADVLLVHNRKEEDRFVAEGYAVERSDVMYNDFIVAGPPADPAGVRGKVSSVEAFRAIQAARAAFASRGDKSGTHSKELSIWAAAGINPAQDLPGYLSVGQGMGETLLFANEKKAYTLADRGTMLAMQAKLPELVVLMGGRTPAENHDRMLLNPYGVMAVNPAKHPGVNRELAATFVQWLTSPAVQRKIAAFGVERFGQPLFYPDSDDYKATRAVTVCAGGKSREFTLDDLRALPPATITGHSLTGVKKGFLGTNGWTGTSLKDLLLRVDPKLGHKSNRQRRITVTASDGWASTLKWAEVFGTPRGGEAIYNVKGCNECHGVDGEGSAPAGKAATPALSGVSLPAERIRQALREGGAAHAGLNPYTTRQLSDTEMADLLAWCADPKAKGKYTVPASKRQVILAYEKNGRPLTGRDGLLQLVVQMDEYAGRFVHWVRRIEVK